MKMHCFQEQKLRAQIKTLWNRILKIDKNRETYPSTKDEKTSAPKKMQTATTGPTTCKVEEQQTSEQPRRAQTASAGPQLCKFESNKNQNHGKKQQTRMEHKSRDVGHEQNCIARHMYNKHLRLAELLGKQLRQ
jgi:hypothetical protein